MPSEDHDRAPLDRRSGLVFASVMVVGALLLQLARLYVSLGPNPGNLLFVALPIVAVLAAASPPVHRRRATSRRAATTRWLTRISLAPGLRTVGGIQR